MTIRFPFFQIVVCFFLLSSCSKTSTSPANASTNASTDPNSVPAIISTGNWKVTAFTETNEDKTQQFQDFLFTFSSDGKVNATANSKVTSGTWTWGGVSYYGVAGDPTLFTINLGAENPLSSISRNWVIASKTATKIDLDSSEPSEKKHVTFTRQ